jgi:hypothetical protein
MTSACRVGPATADTRAALAQDPEKFEELVALSGVEAPEDLIGAVAPSRLEAVQQESSVIAEHHEDRSPIAGIGVAHHEPGRLEGVDHGRDRPGDHVELGGQVGHPQGPPMGGDEAKHAGLGIGEAQRGELHDRSSTEPTRSMGEEFGQLEGGIRSRLGLIGTCVGGHPAPRESMATGGQILSIPRYE